MLINRGPKTPLCYYGKGSILYELKRYNEACVSYEQALHLDPGNAYGWYSYSVALQAAKHHDRFLFSLQQAESLEPNIHDMYPDWLYAL
jgi:tetratricopeptide (TPR) repeat protein